MLLHFKLLISGEQLGYLFVQSDKLLLVHSIVFLLLLYCKAEVDQLHVWTFQLPLEFVLALDDGINIAAHFLLGLLLQTLQLALQNFIFGLKLIDFFEVRRIVVAASLLLVVYAERTLLALRGVVHDLKSLVVQFLTELFIDRLQSVGLVFALEY